MKYINYSVENGIARISINNPPANTIDPTILTELMQALYLADRNPKVKSKILTGEGRFFSAGFDLNFAAKVSKEDMLKMLDKQINTIVLMLRASKKPTVAVVNGPAAGAGAGFILASQFRVFSENAKLVFPFPRIGLMPAAGIQHTLAEIIGKDKTQELLAKYTELNAEELLRLGVASRIYSNEQLMQEAFILAQKAKQPVVNIEKLSAQLKDEVKVQRKGMKLDILKTAIAKLNARKTEVSQTQKPLVKARSPKRQLQRRILRK